jgi:TolB protein
MGGLWHNINKLMVNRKRLVPVKKSKITLINILIIINLISALMISALIFLNTTNSDSSSKLEKIVFDAQKGNGTFGDIWIMNTDGSNQKQITSDSYWDWNPDLSPDGKKIAFISDRVSPWDIWIMNVDGSNKTQLTTDPAKDYYPDWSPDGNKIVFASKRTGNWDIWIIDANGSNEVQLTSDAGTDWDPAWSPDGNKIVFTSSRGGSSDIWVMDIDGSNKTQLTTDPNFEWDAAWSPDGNKIAFGTSKANDEDIWVMDSDGSNQTQLTTGPNSDWMPVWSPNGKMIAFARDDDIWVMDMNGNNQVQLTSDSGGNRFPDWGQVVTIPDLIVGKISTDIPSPICNGSFVLINATIYNVGEGNASNVDVKFYDNEIKPENQIGNNQTILFIERFSGIGFAEVQWIATSIGIHNIFVVVDPNDNITESNETNNVLFKVIKVIAILPPELYIKAIGNDIILNWTPQKIIGLSHFLLYRSTSQVGFDFSRIWNDTSQHNDNGIIPLRTTWNDTGAASISAPQEYYYTIRSVLNTGEISPTSRTVGKWTKTFPKGISTFSLPLEPIEPRDIDFHTTNMNADYIRYMNATTRRWMTHNYGDGTTNNTQMKVGEGYEVKFGSQSIYTVTGIPGAMIGYDDDSGFIGFNHTTEANNLIVTIEPNGDVNLAWPEPSSMNNGWYEIYFSNKRDGFFGIINVSYFPVCNPVIYGNNSIIHLNALVNKSGTRIYYMVVPFNGSGIKGSSTYSLGIWTEEYLSHYDTFGIPLKLNNNNTADEFCDIIPNVVGLNYYNVSAQRWCWHSTKMPSGAYDPKLMMTEGYQISTSNTTKFTFIGI